MWDAHLLRFIDHCTAEIESRAGADVNVWKDTRKFARTAFRLTRLEGEQIQSWTVGEGELLKFVVNAGTLTESEKGEILEYLQGVLHAEERNMGNHEVTVIRTYEST